MALRRTFILVTLFAFLVACRDRRDLGYESSFGSAAVHVTPEIREYVLQSQRGYYYWSQVKSWRRISEQPRDGKVLHSETEMSCPDRFHLKVTGPTDYERYVIGDQMWERRNTTHWTRSTLAPPVADLARCKWAEEQTRRRAPDEADIENMLPHYNGVQVTKLGKKVFAGIECQEYSHRWTEGGGETLSCIATGDKPYPVHTESNGAFTTTFDFDKPIRIEPPKAD